MSKRAARILSEGQREYEARRAAKAGVSLEKWLDNKHKQQTAAVAAKEKAATEAAKPAKPGLFKRLLDRAHQPLGAKDTPKSR
jgi:hypothetical protein